MVNFISEPRKFVGEIINSSVFQWTTQAWRWDDYPAFGSLVELKSGEVDIFGVIFQIWTGSEDENLRRIFAHQKTETELLREQPQIFEFLQTYFNCFPLAYSVNGAYVYSLPPRPPKIHSFVQAIDQVRMVDLVKSPKIAHTLFTQASKVEHFEDLLLAFLQYLNLHGCATRELILQIVDQYALFLANDYRRLKIFVDRLGELK